MIAGLWSRFSGWLIGALAVLATIAAVYLRGRSAGKKVEQAKEAKRELAQERARAETMKEANHVQTEIARLPDDAVRERLRKWTRDH